jgi:REP-associated tyrosine transposase
MKYKKVKRYNITGHGHVLTFSCYHKYPLLSKARACIWLSEAINSSAKRHSISIAGYVIMPDHVHLLAIPKKSEYDISVFLKGIKQTVARKAKSWLIENDSGWLSKLEIVNGKGKRVFRFWQPGGGYDKNVTDGIAARAALNYIHNNPVRKKLVDKPTDYKWSSSRFYEFKQQGPIIVESLGKF